VSELSPEIKDQIRERVNTVEKLYSVYDVLQSAGINSIPDPFTPTQLSCLFHKDESPSARYYPSSANKLSNYHCFSCKRHFGSVGLYAEYNKLKFMEALIQLERKFNIKIKKQDSVLIKIPDDSKQSPEWSNIPRLIDIAETKLRRNRDKCGFPDFIKFCRVIDHVTWDYEHSNMKPTQAMVDILSKLIFKLNNVETLNV